MLTSKTKIIFFLIAAFSFSLSPFSPANDGGVATVLAGGGGGGGGSDDGGSLANTGSPGYGAGYSSEAEAQAAGKAAAAASGQDPSMSTTHFSTRSGTYEYYNSYPDDNNNNSYSPPLPPPPPPTYNLAPSAVSFTGFCQTIDDFNDQGECATIQSVHNMYNGGTGSVSSGVAVWTTMSYREVGDASWISIPADYHTSGVPAGGYSPNITNPMPALTPGQYELQLTVNEPRSGAFSETTYADNSTTRTFDVEYPPAELALETEDDIIPTGDTTRVTWEISSLYPLDCEIGGIPGGFVFTHTPIHSDNLANPLEIGPFTNATTPVLRCISPEGTLPTVETDTFIEVGLTVQEI